MATFKRIKAIKSILEEFPGIKTYKELDILIEIGYHQETDCPLTIKQLLSLGIASDATVRRQLSQLILSGMVVKGEMVSDHRAVILLLSDETIENMVSHIGNVMERLGSVVAASPVVKKSKKSIK